jgi:uncharacterized RmlC-like cupin family protein/chloramphenicol O-acetyltransferase
MRTGRRLAPIHGLVSLDVTEARSRLAAASEPLSFTAFVVASVGRAAAAHPEVHAYRDWRGRLVVHHFVDVATIVEVIHPDGSFPLAHLVRDADIRSVADISAEVRRVKSDPATSPSGSRLEQFPWPLRLPGAFRAFYASMARSPRMRRLAGTVEVTAVGMFGGGDGYGITVPTVATLGIVVGGISERPLVVDGVVAIRHVLDLTVTVDHNVVDGAPAARFVQDLRGIIESAKVLDERPRRPSPDVRYGQENERRRSTVADITVVRPEERTVADSDATSGMVREEAIANGDVWAGFVTAAPQRPSGWHHHGDYDTYIYVDAGRVMMEFGPGGSRSIEARPGDFIHVPKRTIHREVNPTEGEATIVLIRIGSGPPVVNVDGPASPV